MTPFEQWFSADWQKALREVPADTTVLSSGFSIAGASWDRRAGYLLWNALGRPNAAWVDQMAPLYAKSGPADSTGPAEVEEIEDLLGDTPAPSTADEIEDLLA